VQGNNEWIVKVSQYFLFLNGVSQVFLLHKFGFVQNFQSEIPLAFDSTHQKNVSIRA